MRLLRAFVVAATTLSVFSYPIRVVEEMQDNTILVLQFAAVLEKLEAEFYKAGIQKFTDQDFQNAGFSSTAIVADQLSTIQGDEEAHLQFLTKALNAFGAPVPDSCQFNFDSALVDVPTMAAVARIVEVTGVAAYAGAAALISDPQVLTAAATILTAEARHQTILNTMSGVGSPIPQAFDFALSPSEVLAIAGPFISGCDLGVPANKPLKITNQGPPGIGTTLTFDFEGKDMHDNLHCQMLIGGAVNTISLPIDQCTVPEGINGPVAIFITSDQQPLLNNPANRQFANNVVAGPNIAFVDSVPNPLSQLLRAGVSAPGGDQVQVGGGLNEAAVQPGPNLSTGSQAGGAVTVDGWINLPTDQSNNGQEQQQQQPQQDGQQQPPANTDPNGQQQPPAQVNTDPNGQPPPADPNAAGTGAVIVSSGSS